VRGYLAVPDGREYQKSRTVCGIRLPEGLVESSEPVRADLYSRHEGGEWPTTSTFHSMKPPDRGPEIAEQVKDSVCKSTRTPQYARERGIINRRHQIRVGLFRGRLILIDKC